MGKKKNRQRHNDGQQQESTTKWLKGQRKVRNKVRHNAKEDKLKKCFWHKNKKQKRNDVTDATLTIQQSPGIHFKE